MTEKNQNELAIQRFIEYIQIKTVQPEPDYNNALKFLKNYAQELGLDYRSITIDEDRQAAVLTVKHNLNFCTRKTICILFSGYHRRRINQFYSIHILM